MEKRPNIYPVLTYSRGNNCPCATYDYGDRVEKKVCRKHSKTGESETILLT